MKYQPTLLLVFLGILLLSACVRPTEERVEQDLAVGTARNATFDVTVEDGLAVVRELTATRIEIWNNAPAVRLQITASTSEFELSVKNVMPEAVLVQTGGEAAEVALVEVSHPTRKRWRVEMAPGAAARFMIAPSDHEVQAPWRFAVLSDIQEAIDRVQDIYRTINGVEGVHFVLGAGDLTEQGTAEELTRFERELLGLEVPYYATLGNHELGTDPCLFQEFFGRGSSHFVYRGVHFSLLDSGSASLDPRVYDWLESWMAAARNRLHVVAMHIAPIDPTGVRNGSFASRPEAAKLLQRLASGDVDLTLYGHVHSYYSFENGGIPAYISGGGGAIPERFDDMGRHFLVVDLDATAGIHDVQVGRVD